jgi:plasmid stabilization system protein ParE
MLPTTARKQPRGLLTFVSSVARLQEHPYLGKAGRIPGTRELVIPRTAYVCAYRVSAGRIEILAIRHGARDWPKHL